MRISHVHCFLNGLAGHEMAGRSKCRLNDRDTTSHHTGDIETDLARPHPVSVNPAHPQFPKSRLLGGRNSRCWRAVGVTRTRLHFAEHDKSSASKNDVDLALTATPIAIDDHIAMLLVPLGCQILAVGPESPATGGQPMRAITGVAVLRAATLRC